MKFSLALNGVVDPGLAGTLERVRWAADHFGPRLLGLEIPGHREYLEREHWRVRGELLPILARFEANSVHLVPVADFQKPSREAEAAYFAMAREVLADYGQALGGRLAVVVTHPDIVFDLADLAGLEAGPARKTLEVMGAGAALGGDPADFARILAIHQEFRLTLDTAHALETAVPGGPGPGNYADQLADSIVHLHLSQPGNLYDPDLMGPSFGTAHSMLHLGGDHAGLFEALALLEDPLPTVESVIPPGSAGLKMLDREMDYIADGLRRAGAPWAE
jgi:hypothetical protein